MKVHSSMEMLIVKEIASQGLRKYDSILEPYPFVSLSSLLRSTIPDLEFGKNEYGMTISKDNALFISKNVNTKNLIYQRMADILLLQMSLCSVISFLKKMESNNLISVIRQEDMDCYVDKCLNLKNHLLYFNLSSRENEEYIRYNFFSYYVPSNELIEFYKNGYKSWHQLRAEKEDKISLIAIIISMLSFFAAIIAMII
jgi:hypothetical protein